MVGPLFLCSNEHILIPSRAVSSQGCTSIIYVFYPIEGLGSLGQQGVKERSDAYVHCIRFDEALKVYILIQIIVLTTAMGECDRKLRLVVGGNSIHTVTRHNVPMLPNRTLVEQLQIYVNRLLLTDTAVRSTNGIAPQTS